MIKPHFRKNEEETGVVEVGEEGNSVKIDAGSAEIIYIDPEKDIQVVMSDDPDNKDGVVCAVMTASAENVEDNKLLGSATAEPESTEDGNGGDNPGGDGGEDEAKKAEARKAEARKRFRERFAARQEARKAEARVKARDEARAKFRAHAKPTGSK